MWISKLSVFIDGQKVEEASVLDCLRRRVQSRVQQLFRLFLGKRFAVKGETLKK